MAGFGLSGYLTLANFAVQALTVNKVESDAIRKDAGNLKAAQAEVLFNNQLSSRNQNLLNEERVALMIANGFKMFELAKFTRAAKADALAARGSTGALSSASLKSSLLDIGRIGGEANARILKNAEFAWRNLTIESQNIFIQTVGINNRIMNQLTQTSSSFGTGLQLASIGIKSIRKLGFAKNSKTGEDEFNIFGNIFGSTA